MKGTIVTAADALICHVSSITVCLHTNKISTFWGRGWRCREGGSTLSPTTLHSIYQGNVKNDTWKEKLLQSQPVWSGELFKDGAGKKVQIGIVRSCQAETGQLSASPLSYTRRGKLQVRQAGGCVYWIECEKAWQTWSERGVKWWLWDGAENMKVLTVVTRGSGISSSRTVAGERTPRLGAAGAMFAEVRQAPGKTGAAPHLNAPKLIPHFTLTSQLFYFQSTRKNTILMRPCFCLISPENEEKS